MKPTLVVLSTNFGTNFSGGCTVTSEIIARLQDQFGKIIFVGARVGEHQVRNLIFKRAKTWLDTYFVLRRLRRPHTIFYGDFYNAFLLALAKTTYIFTYHDNWPELAELSYRYKIENIFYSKIYQYIFNHANRLITVSEYKKDVASNLTDTEIEVIPNGFNQTGTSSTQVKKEGILMVGNIDQRKYKIAVDLFRTLENTNHLKIDIYGHIVDERLAKELEKFPFVKLKGFHSSIPFESYKMLLHTSYVESFGMVFVEAIAMGLPVLTFDRGGAKEIIGNDNGILIEPYQIHKMKEALSHLIHNPMRANPESVKKYTWETAAASYLEVFEKLS